MKIRWTALKEGGKGYEKSGSVLLLTLMVVSLLMVVVLAFSIVVRMELRSVRSRQHLLQARAHARLGAELAIARLQETVGPDTRVSAPIQDVAARPNQRWIVQAIDSAAYRLTSGGGLELNPAFTETLGYFVSADDAAFDPVAYWPFDASGQPTDGNVLLVGPGSVSTDQDSNADGVPDGFVAAPLLELGSGPEGSFAWWIGDNGLKAQINLVDPYFESTGTRTNREQLTTAQRYGSEVVLSQYDPGNATHNEVLRRSYNLEQLNLVAGSELSPGVATNRFHDVTLKSFGLPSNTRRGGLKRDLTAVIKEAEANGGAVGGTQWDQLQRDQELRIARWREETAALDAGGLLGQAPGVNRHLNALQAMTLREDQSNAVFRDLIFPPLTDMHTQFDPGGAKWEQLITWATLKDRQSSGGAVTAQNRWKGNEMQLSPVIARAVLSTYATEAYPDASMHFIPIVVLWNPYNVPLRMNSNPANAWRILFKFEIGSRENFWMRLRVSHSDWSAPNASEYAHIPPSGGNPRSSLWTPCFRFRWDSSEEGQFIFQLRDSSGGTSVVIPPGQARIFSMHEHVDVSPVTAGDPFDPTVELREGLPAGAEMFSLYLTENLEDQMDDGPHEHYEGVNDAQRTRPSLHREAGGGYNVWQPTGIGGGTFRNRPQSLPYPFPLDPATLGFNPASYASVADYQAAVRAEILYDFSNPPAPEICVNSNYLREWTIEEIGLEFGRTNNQGNISFGDLRITLDEGPGSSPMAEIMHPSNNTPTILSLARLSDIDNTSTDQQGNPIDQITPSLPARETPAADEGFPFDTPFSWGIAYGLRLPENPYTIDAGSGNITGNTSDREIAPVRWLTDFNPVTPFPMRDPSSRISDDRYANQGRGGFNSPPSYVGGFFMGDNRFSNLTWMTPDDLNQFIGTTDDFPSNYVSGAPKAVLFEVPDSSEDLVNPASLMHAPLIPTRHDLMPQPGNLPGMRYSDHRNSTDLTELPYALAWSQVNYGYMQPTYMIGNSRAHLLVTRGRAEQSFYESAVYSSPSDVGESIPYTASRNPNSFGFNGGWRLEDPPPAFFPGYDASWVYNEVLWDDYFFTPELNTMQQWADGLQPDDRDYITSAENVMILGSFNVNSDSIPAWAALLSSMLEVDMGTGEDVTGISPFSRFLQPQEQAFDPDDDDPTSVEAFGGYRRLTRSEIWNDQGTPEDLSDDTGLAVYMVRQVRERGPFLSMSDFVNRALLPEASDTNGHGLAGALQTAIDQMGLNQAMGEPGDTDFWLDPATEMTGDLTNATGSINYGDAFIGLHRSNMNTWVGDPVSGSVSLASGGRRNSGASGELTQADLLSKIGSVLQVRSDTFTIRAQGIQGNADSPSARAWCEVTVQRVPEYVDAEADDPGVLPGNLTSPANRQFGRRFRVTSFRWLSEEEI